VLAAELIQAGSGLREAALWAGLGPGVEADDVGGGHGQRGLRDHAGVLARLGGQHQQLLTASVARRIGVGWTLADAGLPRQLHQHGPVVARPVGPLIPGGGDHQAGVDRAPQLAGQALDLRLWCVDGQPQIPDLPQLRVQAGADQLAADGPGQLPVVLEIVVAPQAGQPDPVASRRGGPPELVVQLQEGVDRSARAPRGCRRALGRAHDAQQRTVVADDRRPGEPGPGHGGVHPVDGEHGAVRCVQASQPAVHAPPVVDVGEHLDRAVRLQRPVEVGPVGHHQRAQVGGHLLIGQQLEHRQVIQLPAGTHLRQQPTAALGEHQHRRCACLAVRSRHRVVGGDGQQAGVAPGGDQGRHRGRTAARDAGHGVLRRRLPQGGGQCEHEARQQRSATTHRPHDTTPPVG
jgi:hypothetical protein